jgi:hypothetical protein
VCNHRYGIRNHIAVAIGYTDVDDCLFCSVPELCIEQVVAIFLEVDLNDTRVITGDRDHG